MKIAGLDIGTTGCKLTVFDERGKYLDKAYQDYPVSRAVSGHEIDINALMDGVMNVIGQTARKFPDIAGIGITSFGETFIMTDENGKPLHSALLYTDPRGADECKELEEKLGSRAIQSITGLKPHEMYSLPKIMWLKRNLPEVFAKTKHIFLIADYVGFMLTGTAQIDYSLASRTMAFDIRELKWSGNLFEAAGIDKNLMSKTVPTGTETGFIKQKIADKTGLSPKTKIIAVSHDQVAAAVGAGVFDSKTAVDGAGTVECLTPVYDSLPDLDVMYEGNYAVVPYVIKGKYVCYAFSYTGGALVQWCVENLAKKEIEIAESREISVHKLLEAEYKTDDPTGIMVLPHFAGAATPYMDTGSKGVIAGLTANTKVSEIYRACMEGVVYEMMLNAEYLKNSGVCYKSLRATGGGAKSEVWTQMKADALNMPITALKTSDAGTVGSAMLTGIAVGIFSNLEDAAKRMVEETKTYYPRSEQHEKYLKIYDRYRNLYKAVRPLM